MKEQTLSSLRIACLAGVWSVIAYDQDGERMPVADESCTSLDDAEQLAGWMTQSILSMR